MPRQLSQAALRSIHSQEGDEEFIFLLAITQDDLPEPIYAARSPYDVYSQGILYLASGFNITMPQEREDQPPEVQLEFANIDRVIIDAVRIAVTAPKVTLTVVLQASPNTIEAGPFDFILHDASWNKMTVTSRLAYEPVLDLPWPSGIFSPNEFPGLFAIPLMFSLYGGFL